MGATSWRYYTPYQSEPEAALQVLRAEMFARGEYVDPTGSMEDLLRWKATQFGLNPDEPEVRAERDQAVRMQRAIQTGDTEGMSRADRNLVQRLRAMGQLASQLGAVPPASVGRRPRSIDELLERAAESGTHSVLDIEHVGRRPGFGIAAPMSESQLRRVFGTSEPSREQVEQHWSDIAESLGRWQARYVVVYREGQMLEYAFIGCSGD